MNMKEGSERQMVHGKEEWKRAPPEAPNKNELAIVWCSWSPVAECSRLLGNYRPGGPARHLSAVVTCTVGDCTTTESKP